MATFLTHITKIWNKLEEDCLAREFNVKQLFSKGISYSEDIISSLEGLTDAEIKFYSTRIKVIEKRLRAVLFQLKDHTIDNPPEMNFSTF